MILFGTKAPRPERGGGGEGETRTPPLVGSNLNLNLTATFGERGGGLERRNKK